MVLTGQVQRELVSLLNAEDAHAVGLSGEDGQLLVAERRPRPGRRRAGRRRPASATSSPSTRRPSRTCSPPAASRWSPPSPSTPASPARCSTSTPTPPPPRSPWRWARPSSSCSPTSRASTPPGRTASSLISQLRAGRARGPAARAASPGWCRRWRRACARCAAACRRRTSSTGARSTRCCWRSSPMPGWARWCCPDEEGHGMTEPTTTPADRDGPDWAQRYGGALMNTFGAPQRVLVRGEGAVRVGRRRAALPRPARRHRRQRPRPRPPGATWRR